MSISDRLDETTERAARLIGIDVDTLRRSDPRQGARMKAIKWAYVHGGLEAEIYPSLKDAVIAAERLSDYGAESLQCIEHDGRLIDEYHPEYIEIDRTERERRDRASAEIRAENADRTKVYVEVRGPEGEWSHYGWGYADDDQGWRAEIADLVELLGKDRVRVSDGD